jgi:small subunit ribosomal protein S8
MNLNDPLGDMITRIRNAQMRGRTTVASPASTLRARVLEVEKGAGNPAEIL